jgi:hypothetical protein
MSGDEVAKAFVQHYYQTWNSNPDALAGLYVSFSPLPQTCEALRA